MQPFCYEHVGKPGRIGAKPDLLGNGANNRTSMGEMALPEQNSAGLQMGSIFGRTALFSGENGFDSSIYANTPGGLDSFRPTTPLRERDWRGLERGAD